MEFRIGDTFTDSLGRLTNEEQKAVKTTAFDLQMNPAGDGKQFHKIARARDKNFWSVRASRDLRLIVHKSAASLLLCYTDHHDEAYAWAERRKIERHPTTGAAQLVEVRELVREVTPPATSSSSSAPRTPAPVAAATTTTTTKKPAASLFADTADDDLLAYGVPPEWLVDVNAATEDTLFDVASHLPQEAAEALLKLAVGETPAKPERTPAGADPFKHPDAERRFRVMADREELERALNAPWDRWIVFLHPAQRSLVRRDFNGPARVYGSAGTGKTVVALHRAAELAQRYPKARLLLTTFSDTLAAALASKLRLLVDGDVLNRIAVGAIARIAHDLYEQHVGPADVADDETVRKLLLDAAAAAAASEFSESFLFNEWRDVIDDWQITSWEQYRDVQRLGRKTRLGEQQRQRLWTIFERVCGELAVRGKISTGGAYARAAEAVAATGRPVFDYIIVDEAQDVGVAQLRFLAVLAGGRANGLFFAGDQGQRIFQTPFSWRSLGVDVRGRSQPLKINYRTTHQIRRRADLLLDEQVADVDGLIEGRRGTVSVFNGAEPIALVFAGEYKEIEGVAAWMQERVTEGIRPGEIAVFVRSEAQLARAQAATQRAGLPGRVLTATDPTAGEAAVACGVMHLAKGLEFRAVVVMACDDEVIPLQERVESVTDPADLEEVYTTERHLLYVACTRARDFLLVTGTKPVSEFLDDLRSRDFETSAAAPLKA